MRQYGCIELTQTDALLLRDAVRPLARVEPLEAGSIIGLCEKLYDALLRLQIDKLPAINMGLDEREALIINQFVSNEDWQGALALLEQTWLVLYELRHERAYPRSFSAPEPAFVAEPAPIPAPHHAGQS